MSLFNLEKQYLFYRGYHKNPVNQLLHIFSIPLLVITISIWGQYLNFTKPNWYNITLPLNLTTLLVSFYSLYYLILNIYLGLVMSILLFANHLITYYLYLNVPYLWIIAIVVHIFSWFIQIMGHTVYEKNKPAFLTGLIQSFLMAPMFVLLEIFFKFGFFKDLEKKIDSKFE